MTQAHQLLFDEVSRLPIEQIEKAISYIRFLGQEQESDALKTIIREKLEESLTMTAEPNAKWYTHEEVFRPLREKYGYEV
jgi:hypothetical protein